MTWTGISPQARLGLHGALDRLEQARLSRKQTEWFVAVTEAVLWLMIADELAWTAPGYQAQRDVDPTGPILLGFRYMWNVIKHHPVDELVVFIEGMTFPMRFDLEFLEARWKPRGALPKPWPSKALPAQIEAYDQRLSSQLVKITVPAAASFFEVRPSSVGGTGSAESGAEGS